MRYTIECANPKAPLDMRSYVVDNKDYGVFLDGRRVDFSHLAKQYQISDFNTSKAFCFNKDKPLISKSHNVLKLRIQVGLACNYNCAYCLQSNLRSKAIKYPEKYLIDKLFITLKSAGIRLAPQGFVDIWGGEPLVYWESVKYLIEKIRREFPSDIYLTLFTNGALLNDDIANTLFESKVHVVISHDGQGEAFRHPVDPLDSPEIQKRWKGYLNQSKEKGVPIQFYSVITPENTDLIALRQYFEEKLGETITVNFGGVASESETLPQSCIFTNDDAARLRLSIFKAMTSEPDLWPGLHRRVANLMTRFIKNIPSLAIRCHCNSAEASVLNIDVNGNVLSCQNRPALTHSIGTVKNLDEVRNDKFIHWFHRPHCKDCLVLGSCKGGCPDLSLSGFNRCCTNEYALHSSVFYTAWWFLTGTLIQNVRPEEKICAL